MANIIKHTILFFLVTIGTCLRSSGMTYKLLNSQDVILESAHNQPSKYRAIVFDLGGVLASWSIKNTILKLQAAGTIIPEEVIAKLLSKAHISERLNYDRGDVDKKTYYQRVIKKIFNNNEQSHFVAEILDSTDDALKIDQEALALLATVKAHGYKIYLLSNLPHAMEQFILRQDPTFFKNFDGIILSYKVHATKPEPTIYNALFTTYNLVPQECLFLDDLEVNIQGGKALGMDGIVYQDADQALNDLVQLGILPRHN